ncbi:L10-interacting MYB domain-containing protein-like isoform X2 [Magnolia sinica]|nr:L10-interacting MYB domain-containing protein-like isoform X2 [Magnolia sinica]XP_058094593.1 L10-interacting MYB domain-containing protein-like isoform X2 [Magnolia sinica]XP_058094602.1 L10-interacting MYB domain-containing protein-like isoform X2 [Magnolia sinica]
MSAYTPSQDGVSKADWTTPRDAYLVELLIEQQNAGKRSNMGWSKEAWKYVVDAFNKRFRLHHNVQQLKSRIAQLKKNYYIVKQLISHSGFAWNSVMHTVTADDDVWDRYLMTHPEARPLRKTGLPLYEILGTLFEEGRSQLSMHRQEESENGGNTPVAHRMLSHSTPSLHVVGDNEEFSSGSEEEIHSDDSPPNKRQGAPVSSTPRRRKRVRVGTGGRIASALERIVAASERLAESTQVAATNEDRLSYEKCLEELQMVEGLDDMTFMKAVHILRDEKNAVAFLTLKGPRRLTWLMLQCSKGGRY